MNRPESITSVSLRDERLASEGLWQRQMILAVVGGPRSSLVNILDMVEKYAKTRCEELSAEYGGATISQTVQCAFIHYDAAVLLNTARNKVQAPTKPAQSKASVLTACDEASLRHANEAVRILETNAPAAQPEQNQDKMSLPPPYLLAWAKQLQAECTEDFKTHFRLLESAFHLLSGISTTTGSPAGQKDDATGVDEEQPLSCVAASVARRLANLLDTKQMTAEATPYLRYPWRTYKYFLGPTHRLVSDSTNALAVNLFSRDMLVEAEELYRQDLASVEALDGPNSLACAEALNNLACLLDRREKFDESDALHKRDMDITIKLRGENHPDVATSENNYATSLLQRGKLVQAEGLFRRALAKRVEAYGEPSVEVAQILNNIARLQKKEKKLVDAQATWKKALRMYEAVLGPNHPSLVGVVQSLQYLAEETCQYEEAERLMERMMELKRSETEALASL